jgi:hypothetical protein
MSDREKLVEVMKDASRKATSRDLDTNAAWSFIADAVIALRSPPQRGEVARLMKALQEIESTSSTRAAAIARDALASLPPSPEDRTDDPLDMLVAKFAKRLLAKLKLARANGRSGWERDDWEADCQRGLLRHLEKGDPRDVAAYCAFMDYHGWITKSPAPPEDRTEGREVREATAAQHFDLPKGKPAQFVRNGVLETCQCCDCRALTPSPSGEDHPDCSTDRECELYDALIGLASHATAHHDDYKQWTQGGVTLEPIVSKALRLSPSSGNIGGEK